MMSTTTLQRCEIASIHGSSWISFFFQIVILLPVLHGRLGYGVGDRVLVTYTIQIHRD